MKMLFWGLLVVLVDFRVDGGPDVILDPVGWLLCFGGVREAWSRTRSTWFQLAMAGAVLGGLLSLEEYVAAPTGWLVSTLTMLTTTALVWGICSGIRECHPDSQRRATATMIRWSDLTLTLITLLLVASPYGDPTGQVGPELLLLAVPMFVVVVWFVIFVARIRPEELQRVVAVPG